MAGGATGGGGSRRARPTGSRRAVTGEGERTRPVPVAPGELSARAQSTREQIIVAARTVFQRMGFGGARMEDIALEASTSRASVYHYFPTKRDVFIAMGRASTQSVRQVLAIARSLPDDWTPDDLGRFVDAYVSFLDEHGAVLSSWSQATWDDHELRDLGMNAQLNGFEVIGEALARLRGGSDVPPVHEGIAVLGMIERLWYYARVGGADITDEQLRTALVAEISRLLRG